MGSSGDSKVRCEHCKRAYAWQGKYAGKKVRCKCGEVLRFPAIDPANDGMDLALNIDSGIDLQLGSNAGKSKSSNAALGTPDGNINVPPPANLGGPTCPSCKNSVRSGAVICINCGFNLKEGSKVNTAVGVQMSGGGMVYDLPADGFFGQIKRSWTFAKISYGIIWDFKQLLIFPVCSGIAAFLILLSFATPFALSALGEAKVSQQRMEIMQRAYEATPEQLAQIQLTEAQQQTVKDQQKAMAPFLPEDAKEAAEMNKEIENDVKREHVRKQLMAQAGLEDFKFEERDFSKEESESRFSPAEYAVMFAFYFCNFFVIAFFNTGLIACAMKVMEGQVPTVGYGFKVAFKRLPQILAWAFVSAIVGLILKIIENTSRKFGKFIALFLGAAWTTLTFFVVPVIAVEGVGPIKAVKRSVKTLNDAWGDALVGNYSMGFMVFLVTLPIYLLLGVVFYLLMAYAPSLPGFIFMIGAFMVVVATIAVVSSAADTVFKAILYSFASGKTMPANIDVDAISSAFAQPHHQAIG